MANKLCIACGTRFQPVPQVPHQSYCSNPACQRQRRKQWQQAKMQSDPDYQENQSRAQRAWLDRNPDYWRNYRDDHPEYVERNRRMQRERAAAAPDPVVAKMDASNAPLPLPAGIYRIRHVAVPVFAKMDAWTIEITLLSATCPCTAPPCKEMT